MAKNFEFFLFNRRYSWLAHIVFWAYVYLDELLSLVGLTPPIEDYPLMFLQFILDAILVYVSLYILIPKFLIPRKYFLFILCSFLLLFINIVSVNFLFDLELPFEENESIQYVAITLLQTSAIYGLAVAAKLFKINYKQKEEQRQLQEETLKTEMAMLKNQLNPHFLFNALNSLYVLAQKNDNEKVQNAILDLAELLRYQTYDTRKTQIPLKMELDFISNYFNFEKLRRSNIEWLSDYPEDIEHVMIPPMLLFPLVENAIKYSSGDSEKVSLIKQKLVIVKDDILFSIENNISRRKVNERAYSGLGLNNLRRRLELLFPNKHEINIIQSEELFKVVMKIPRESNLRLTI